MITLHLNVLHSIKLDIDNYLNIKVETCTSEETCDEISEETSSTQGVARIQNSTRDT